MVECLYKGLKVASTVVRGLARMVVIFFGGIRYRYRTSGLG